MDFDVFITSTASILAANIIIYFAISIKPKPPKQPKPPKPPKSKYRPPRVYVF